MNSNGLSEEEAALMQKLVEKQKAYKLSLAATTDAEKIEKTRKSLVDWMSANKQVSVVSETPNTYTVKDGSVKTGLLMIMSNGRSYQVGTSRFWALK